MDVSLCIANTTTANILVTQETSVAMVVTYYSGNIPVL